MNIFEAYLKKYGQFILLVLGLPCTNKSEIVEELVSDLNIPKININNYIKKDNYIEKIFENVKFKLYEYPENYEWDNLNKEVNEKKGNGVILYGNYIDIDKLDFNVDFIYFIDINNNLCKTLLLEKKLLPYEKDDDIKIYFKHIFNPLYDKLKENLKINKFFNVKENTTFEQVYDELFDNLMELIHKKL